MTRMTVVLVAVAMAIQNLVLAGDDPAAQLTSPFACFKEARAAFAERDAARLQGCLTTSCQNALVGDLSIAFERLPDETARAGKQADAAIAAKVRFDEYRLQQITQWTKAEFRRRMVPILEAFGAEASRIPQDVLSEEGQQAIVAELKRAGFDDDREDAEFERNFHHILEDMDAALEKMSADYEDAYKPVLFLMLINREKLDRAQRCGSEMVGGFRKSDWTLKEFAEVTKAEYEPFLTLTGTLKEVSTEKNGSEATGLVVQRDGKRLLWQVEFVKRDGTWLIDSLGYGDRLEPVLDGKFVQRPLGKWEIEVNNEDESR